MEGLSSQMHKQMRISSGRLGEEVEVCYPLDIC